MANVITKQTLVDGTRNLVVKIHILADTALEYTNNVLIDASIYNPASTDIKIMGIHASLTGFTATLLWDGTVNVPIVNIPDFEYNLTRDRLQEFGGFVNNAGAGKTGDILLTTAGLGIGDKGSMTIVMQKNNRV